jgi:hypothetical protein
LDGGNELIKKKDWLADILLNCHINNYYFYVI